MNGLQMMILFACIFYLAITANKSYTERKMAKIRRARRRKAIRIQFEIDTKNKTLQEYQAERRMMWEVLKNV